MKTISIASLALFSFARFAAAATPIVDSFDGGLDLWNVGGDADILVIAGNSVAALTTAHPSLEFGVDAVNLSGNAPLEGGGDLEAFVGADYGSLDLGLFEQATEGSAIVISTTISLGDVLSFDWNLLTHDVYGLDYAYLIINGEIVETLSSASSIHPSDAGFGNESGFSTVSYTFTSEGPVTIAIGVVDIADYAGTSTLLLDNFTIVPEPSAYLLGVLGLAPLARRRRRR